MNKEDTNGGASSMRLLPVARARKQVGASATTWWRWKQKGLLPGIIEIGGKQFLDADQWDAFLAQKRDQATPPGLKAA